MQAVRERKQLGPLSLHRTDRTGCAEPRCENFLYGFKAAPRGCSRRRLGALAVAPAAAPATAGPTPGGWREKQKLSGRH